MIIKKTILSVILVMVFCGNAGGESVNPALFDPLMDVCDLVSKHYVRDTENDDLVAAAINGMLHELDIYSEYFPAQDLDEFEKMTSSTYEGIGIGIDMKDGYLIVISPFQDSPAQKAGVEAGDRILEVNGQSTKGWFLTRAIKNLTGPAGTEVRIKVLRKDGDTKELTIMRERIQVPTVRPWYKDGDEKDYLLDDDSGIAYMRITQFTSDTSAEFDAAYERILEQQGQAIIMDLRGNPGGLMSAAVAIIDRLISHGVIISTKGAHSQENIKRAQSRGTYPHRHMVVMIDGSSASAAEIVAGALQDHNRAVIVGKRSWGKGSVQQVIRLPESGAALKLTTDHYYLPKGRCVHRLPDAKEWGVDPDVEQELDYELLDDLRNYTSELNSGANQDKSEETLTKAEKLKKMLGLDAQLNQAYKQCKGLLRAQPSLEGLASEEKTDSDEE